MLTMQQLSLVHVTWCLRFTWYSVQIHCIAMLFHFGECSIYIGVRCTVRCILTLLERQRGEGQKDWWKGRQADRLDGNEILYYRDPCLLCLWIFLVENDLYLVFYLEVGVLVCVVCPRVIVGIYVSGRNVRQWRVHRIELGSLCQLVEAPLWR